MIMRFALIVLGAMQQKKNIYLDIIGFVITIFIGVWFNSCFKAWVDELKVAKEE